MRQEKYIKNNNQNYIIKKLYQNYIRVKNKNMSCMMSESESLQENERYDICQVMDKNKKYDICQRLDPPPPKGDVNIVKEFLEQKLSTAQLPLPSTSTEGGSCGKKLEHEDNKLEHVYESAPLPKMREGGEKCDKVFMNDTCPPPATVVSSNNEVMNGPLSRMRAKYNLEVGRLNCRCIIRKWKFCGKIKSLADGKVSRELIETLSLKDVKCADTINYTKK